MHTAEVHDLSAGMLNGTLVWLCLNFVSSCKGESCHYPWLSRTESIKQQQTQACYISLALYLNRNLEIVEELFMGVLSASGGMEGFPRGLMKGRLPASTPSPSLKQLLSAGHGDRSNILPWANLSSVLPQSRSKESEWWRDSGNCSHCWHERKNQVDTADSSQSWAILLVASQGPRSPGKETAVARAPGVSCPGQEEARADVSGQRTIQGIAGPESH